MSVSENKALVRRYFEEVWNNGRGDMIDELCAADSVVHGLDGKTTSGRDALKAFHAKIGGAFSDQSVRIEALIAEDDLVTVRWTRTATHSGHGLGVAPTGRKIAFAGVLILRVNDGKIVEGWNCYDRLGMLQQIGQIPASTAL